MKFDTLIAPTDLRDFLKSYGWTVNLSAQSDNIYLLENQNFPRRQLAYPMQQDAPDYQDSLIKVFEKLSELTGQTLPTLLSRISSFKDDVIQLRISFGGQDNVLPLSFAAAFIQSTEKLLKASACTVLKPRAHHPKLSLTDSSQFVEKAKFQQTERGSFILKVACPIHSMGTQGSLELGEPESPFVRQVTLVLQNSLVSLVSAIEADTLDQLVSNLKSSESPIISSNLCEALTGMHDERIDNALDISFNWSSVLSTPVTKPIRIQREYFSRIDAVQRELRTINSHKEDTFIGTVERLDGVMDTSGQRSGDVILSLLLPDEGETVRVKTTLTAADYAKADQAHMQNGAYVMVTGRLLSGRQPRQLSNLSHFSLVQSPS
jgi:hypothetical protein